MKENYLNFVSYNIKGFKNRNFDYVKSLFASSDVLFLQETWLYDSESDMISTVLPNCRHHSVSAMNDSDVGRLGRPHGGVALAWKSSLDLVIDPINIQNNRICAIKVLCNGLNYILISIYMPVNDGPRQSYQEFGDVMHEISSLEQLHDDCILVGGDFNIIFTAIHSQRKQRRKNQL